ncbi:type I-B CRISPR-associated protein Cas7/Cst2/DevR [Sedimentibacter saalensis]|uniref:CRISPR-associated Cst2 family autoregulator n=1 Tax=Sedimentibacter saalensis TaxID=130788 RepID=A0A562JEA8_9FIRM|nr:type I-B CRISPR-associated protein Cas7/Cst2/DevR [Sedimentibacter saalensis]TWH81353.1 CRISPR-associated Cst2 family autoregulator [Sedimentibacter saalensis]
MKKNGLTITMVIEAQSANYGEGIGNISQLKKMTKGNGETYSYISRQAIRYNIVNQMQCDNTPVEDAGVVQFAPMASISDYPEIDLFGYMKTSSKSEDKKGGQNIRSAVVRLSNAISLEPYKSDLDFLTNIGLAKRKVGLDNAIAQSEIHNSLYVYTITIDLDRIGEDSNDNVSLPRNEKARRVRLLLDTVQFLYRDIKGRRENLSPVFAVGGVYERKNPYFEGRVELSKKGLNIEMVQAVIDSCEDCKNNTVVGCLNGKFSNQEQIKSLEPKTIDQLFDYLKKEVDIYYA